VALQFALPAIISLNISTMSRRSAPLNDQEHEGCPVSSAFARNDCPLPILPIKPVPHVKACPACRSCGRSRISNCGLSLPVRCRSDRFRLFGKKSQLGGPLTAVPETMRDGQGSVCSGIRVCSDAGQEATQPHTISHPKAIVTKSITSTATIAMLSDGRSPSHRSLAFDAHFSGRASPILFL
jgi:hypothetical protein